MKHIIGLGNPGFKYKKTRHNIGFIAVDFLAGNEKWQKSKKGNLEYVWVNTNDTETELIKPQTYMNNSGVSVAYIKKKNPKMSATDLVVIHDDVDIPFGETKITLTGSSGGNNGIKSIINHLGTQDFIRLRIGIGKDPNIPTDKYVLQKFTKDEKDKLKNILEKTDKAIQMIINDEIEQAQKYYNTKTSA